MVVCDVCKKNKATRKITYPTMIPVEDATQFRGVDLFRTFNGYKREDTECNICQQCLDRLAMNRGYVVQLTKEMIYELMNQKGTKNNE